MGKNYMMIITIAFVAIMLMILPVAATKVEAGRYINAGATVFIGEENLDITHAMDGDAKLGYWAAGAVIDSSSPFPTDSVSNPESYSISQSQFGLYTGTWYHLKSDMTRNGTAFYVKDPSLSLNVMTEFNDDVGGKTIVAGTNVTFKIKTNIVLDDKREILESGKYYPVNITNSGDKGFMNIIVKSESGAEYTALQTPDKISVPIQKLFVNSTDYQWNGIWNTGATTNGQRVYQSGNYLITVESLLNNMRENYRNAGAAYTGKTVSSVVTVTLGSDNLKINSNKDSIVRGKPFSVTITGKASTSYNVWVRGTHSMGNDNSSRAPMINAYQSGVNVSDPNTAGYRYQNGVLVVDDVAWVSDVNHTIDNPYFALVTTDSSGTRVVEFTTSSNTKDQKYTIRVETTGGTTKSDEVDVKVGKGGVTLAASGDGSYYLGEEIKLSGTNTESADTFLFITGPNLDSNGARINEPSESVVSGDESTFKDVVVDSDNIFKYTWGTASIDLDSGTYTVYAVSKPVDRSKLQDTSYATVSVTIKKPFVSAAASQPSVAKGDPVFIEGHAEGNPSSGVAIWILGKNYAKRFTQSVDSDSTYKYEIKSGETDIMATGQYFIVVQHPMQNNVFDIDIRDAYVYNKQLSSSTSSDGLNIFKLYGSGSLQGTDAAEALVQAINDPNVDDTYTKLNILIEEPLIVIDPIGDKHIGDRFTLNGRTNLAIDDDIMVEAYSSSFKPTAKTQSGEFAGVTQTVKVVKGDSGLNKFSLDIDTSTFKVDEYIVTAQGITQGTTGTTLFNIITGASTTVPTPTPVAIVTAPVIVTVPATVPPTVAITPTPTPTKSPGYGAFMALIGLGAIAFIVVRRE